MNGILTGYLMRAILTSSALVLAVLLALAGLFEFIAELDQRCSAGVVGGGGRPG